MQAHYTADNGTPTPSPDPSEEQWTRPRDPRVMRYSEETGPWMPPLHRAVYKFVSEFCRPENGEAFPSQEHIGSVYGLSRPTIRKICDQIEAIGAWRIEKRPNARGYLYNVYHFAGLASGWDVVVPKADKHEIFLTPSELTLLQMRRQLEEAMHRLVGAGITADDIIAINDIEHLPNPCKIDDFTWDEDDGQGQGEDPGPDVEFVDMADTSLNDVARLLEARADPVAEFVDANLESLIRPKGPFDHRGGALQTLRNSPAEYERWQKVLKPRERAYGFSDEDTAWRRSLSDARHQARMEAHERGETFDADRWYRDYIDRQRDSS